MPVSELATPDTDLHAALQKYFGYGSFRPLQEQIIRETLKQRDVFALLPTGGGKSLCYQLPALLRPGLTVVVSPLIALMKDQVDGLQANGIPATFLNSTLDGAESWKRRQTIEAGRCKLLYVAPERLMLPDFLLQLKDWNVTLFAIDEAHCISEWGHDFRPEYRQLARLRDVFPGVPFAVFTATATKRVREDIVAQLRLKTPQCFAASFNRPNLCYKIVRKRDAESQVLELVRARTGDSGIVYCQSRKATESLAEWLRDNGIKALPYHAGLDANERAKNQELFRRDDVQVICATIAFGMGVNKPNVRFVIHYDLPKNIEGYYQETGRAGRDGLESDCVLLFSPGDIVKQTRFIDQMENLDEAAIARQQLRRMADFAQSSGCRRVPLLKYFGEEYTEKNCGACDECLNPRDEYDATIPAQKFMSCVMRIKQNSPQFGATIRYVAQVLRGEHNEIMQRWRHDQLTTFGIGTELGEDEWQQLARELLSSGLLREIQDGKYMRIEVSEPGRKALAERTPIMLRAAAAEEESGKRARKSRKGSAKKAFDGEYDIGLFERLRALRKKLADEREVPAYVVFSDATLREMARVYPEDDRAFATINGVGEKKRQEFAGIFLAEIKAHIQQYGRREFAAAAPGVTAPAGPLSAAPKKLNATTRATLKLFDGGLSISEIAEQRNLVENTIWDHLIDAAQAGQKIDINRVLSKGQQLEIVSAFAESSSGLLKEVFEKLGGRFSYGALRLFRIINGK